MNHRHLRIPEGTPAEKLPSAALVDILDRGDLEDWRPIAAAIAEKPFGELAERVLDLVEAHPMFGTSRLWRTWIHRRRALAEDRSRPSADLATLRRRRGMTQAELSRRRGISQSDLSKLERRADVRLSTLRAHAEALGGRLRVIYAADGEEIELVQHVSRKRTGW